MKHFFTDHILPYIPEVIRKDFPQILLALIVTSLIFFNYHQKTTITQWLDTELNLNLPENVVLKDDRRPAVRVNVKVANEDKEMIAEKRIELILNEKDGIVSPDRKTIFFRFTPKMVQAESGIEIVKFKPESMKLEIDTIVSRKMKVVPCFAEQLSPDLKLGRINVIPAEIDVSGPSEELQQLHEIKTVPISLKDIASSFDCDAKTVNYPALRLFPKKVTVQVEIIPNRKTQLYRAVPIRIMGRTAEQRKYFTYEIISSPTANITLEGKRSSIQLLRQNEIIPYVDMSRFTKPGQYQVDVCCSFGKDGIITKQIQPKTVTVKVETSSK